MELSVIYLEIPHNRKTPAQLGNLWIQGLNISKATGVYSHVSKAIMGNRKSVLII